MVNAVECRQEAPCPVFDAVSKYGGIRMLKRWPEAVSSVMDGNSQ